MHITTKVVSSNPVHGEMYLIQHNVLKFIRQWLATGGWFSPGTAVSANSKTDHQDITETFLTVELNTITLNHLSERSRSVTSDHMSNGRKFAAPMPTLSVKVSIHLTKVDKNKINTTGATSGA